MLDAISRSIAIAALHHFGTADRDETAFVEYEPVLWSPGHRADEVGRPDRQELSLRTDLDSSRREGHNLPRCNENIRGTAKAGKSS
ncbi:hypothetical protein H7I53_25535 [Mycolicibacterium pulveris]|uniref:hypothetical protein n=1 Tax=Mycolicibacterium pulveris TaxID=36813 RepID=UPI0013D3286D|nr:hypothetical protein [Mycolicibacterium pulveris]MCV6983567.1 hypothetical protein [Mycolicibacterium pulveris]